MHSDCSSPLGRRCSDGEAASSSAVGGDGGAEGTRGGDASAPSDALWSTPATFSTTSACSTDLSRPTAAPVASSAAPAVSSAATVSRCMLSACGAAAGAPPRPALLRPSPQLRRPRPSLRLSIRLARSRLRPATRAWIERGGEGWTWRGGSLHAHQPCQWPGHREVCVSSCGFPHAAGPTAGSTKQHISWAPASSRRGSQVCIHHRT